MPSTLEKYAKQGNKSTLLKSATLIALILATFTIKGQESSTSGRESSTTGRESSTLGQQSSSTAQKSLERVSREITQITRTLNANKQLLKAERDELLQAEKKLGQITKDLVQTTAALKQQTQAIEELNQQITQQENELRQSRIVLANLLRKRYQQGQNNHLKALLNQENPYAVGRLGNYHLYFRQAVQRKYQQVQTAMQEAQSLQTQLSQAQQTLSKEQTRLSTLQQTQQAQQSKRQSTIAKLDQKVLSNEEQLSKLKNDRKRLTALIQQLKKQAEELARIERQRAEQAAREAAAAAERAKQQGKPTPVQPRPRRRLMAGGFLKQKGRLSYPVSTTPSVTFGSRMVESGMRSDGMMFPTQGSQDVRTIFKGRVLFADYLKGYGLLLIVDHGDDHISLYGHNATLLKSVGDWVETGDVIAKTGLTGGRKKHGLYFEIRNNAEPVNPATWCQ